jgi:hypothetical protein
MKSTAASWPVVVGTLLSVCLTVPVLRAAETPDGPAAPDFARLDRIFENYRLDAHVPGSTRCAAAVRDLVSKKRQ